MTNQLNTKKQNLRLDDNYINFVNNIKDRLKTAQLRAARAVNHELVTFYWKLGKDLVEKQKAFKWGEHFLEQVSTDLKTAFPGMKGFSRRNLQRMRQFAKLYPNLLIAPQAVAQLPWGHISQ